MTVFPEINHAMPTTKPRFIRQKETNIEAYIGYLSANITLEIKSVG